MVLIMKIIAFQNVMPCGLVGKVPVFLKELVPIFQSTWCHIVGDSSLYSHHYENHVFRILKELWLRSSLVVEGACSSQMLICLLKHIMLHPKRK